MSDITCLVCKKTYKSITNSHLRSHNLTFSSYLSLYPYADIKSDNQLQASKKTQIIRSQFIKTDQHAYAQAPKKCLHCSSTLPYLKRKNKFCNKSCAALLNNKYYPKRKPEGQCDICKIPIKTTSKYCSRNCGTIGRKDLIINSTRTRRKDLKKICVEYKGNKCAHCGYNRSLHALCFHHIDPKTKSFGISDYNSTHDWDTIQAELDKCILLCSNCHYEEHERLSLS